MLLELAMASADPASLRALARQLRELAASGDRLNNDLGLPRRDGGQ